MGDILKWITDLLKSVQFWVTIAPWEVGVRVRLGKHTKQLGPGVHLRIPLVDHITPVNTRIRIAAFPCVTVSTTDGPVFTAAGLVGFRIVDPLLSMQTFKEPETSCSAFAQGVAAEYISVRTSGEVNPCELETYAMEQLAHSVSGIEFEFVRLTDCAAVRTIRLLQESWRPETRPAQSHENSY